MSEILLDHRVITDERLLTILNQIRDVMVEERYNMTKPCFVGEYSHINPTSDEYLQTVCRPDLKEKYKFPNDQLLTATNNAQAWQPTEEGQRAQRRYKTLMKKLAARLNFFTTGITALYPPDGYIGWHHNGDVVGRTFLFTYSPDGKGCFKFWNKHYKDVVIVPDYVGWSVKLLNFVDQEQNEVDELSWHAADCENMRISIGICELPQPDQFKAMVEEVLSLNPTKVVNK